MAFGKCNLTGINLEYRPGGRMGKFLIKRAVISVFMVFGVMLPARALVTIPAKFKKIEFAGRKWAIKEFEDFKVGPGPNLFSKENVWVDEKGYLHLKIYKDSKTGEIYCAEVYSEDTFLYGTFEVELAEIDYNKFPINAVLGLFTYRGKGEEIDLEFTYMFWTDNFANYSVQPLPPIYKFTPDLSKDTKHIIRWASDSVEFESICSGENYRKKFASPELMAKLPRTKLTYTPVSCKPARFHMNLWFHHKPAPPLKYVSKKYKNSRNLEEFEVVIKNFEYYPVPLAEKSITKIASGNI